MAPDRRIRAPASMRSRRWSRGCQREPAKAHYNPGRLKKSGVSIGLQRRRLLFGSPARHPPHIGASKDKAHRRLVTAGGQTPTREGTGCVDDDYEHAEIGAVPRSPLNWTFAPKGETIGHT